MVREQHFQKFPLRCSIVHFEVPENIHKKKKEGRLTPFLRRVTAVGPFLRIVDAVAKNLPARSGIRYSHVIELVGTILHLLAAHTHRGDRYRLLFGRQVEGRLKVLKAGSPGRSLSSSLSLLSIFTRRATRAD